MTISVIRKITDEDRESIESSAVRFAARHNIDVSLYDNAFEAVELETQHQDLQGDPRLKNLWKNCFCRAVGEPRNARLCIGWGNLGIDIS